MKRFPAPKPDVPTWDDSEEWAYALRERRTYQTGQSDADLDIWQWEGEQKAALLLAVLHMVAACAGHQEDLWLLRRWLTLNAERDVDDVTDRVVSRVRRTLRRLDPDSSEAARLAHAWRHLTVDSGELPPSRRLYLAAASAHARWLLDAELVAKRGGLLPHTTVRILEGRAVGRRGVVYDLHWLDDSGPPVGYTVRLDDWSTRLDVPAEALREAERPTQQTTGRRKFGRRGPIVSPHD